MSGACPACAGVPLPQDFEKGSNQTAPKLQYSVPDIHCAACIGKIERGLSGINGVSAVRVNLSLKRARVTVNPGVAAAPLIKALSGAGFKAAELDPLQMQLHFQQLFNQQAEPPLYLKHLRLHLLYHLIV